MAIAPAVEELDNLKKSLRDSAVEILSELFTIFV